jgi:hypothetical protein
LPRPELEVSHQLFILVPSNEVDSTMLTRRVWELANAGAFHVQFIGICNDAGEELVTRRALVTMSSMMNYGSVTSDFEVIIDKNWVDNLKARVNPGDMVVYWDIQTEGSLRQLLRADLNVPLYIIPGKSAPQDARSAWSNQVTAWIGFIGILLGFLFLQIKIYQLANSWATVLTLILVIVEFWLIWVWHNWFK